MPNHVEQQIQRANGTYGELNTVNDTVAGGQPSALTNNARYAAQAGARLVLDYGGVQGVTTALRGGWYQYVQFYLSSTAANAAGQVVAWATVLGLTAGSSPFELYVVTPDTASAAAVGKIAGVALNAVTKGNWGFIQTKGLASVLFSGSGLPATPADGDLVIADGSNAGSAISINDSGSGLTVRQFRAAIGIAIGAPTISTKSLVLLRGIADVI